MKRWMAGIGTAAVMVGVLAVLGWRRAEPMTPAAGCEQCVRQVFEAGAKGDVAGYLDQFTGDLRRRLDEEVRQRTAEGFAQHLKETVGPLKGWASFPAEFSAAGEAQIKLERVYAEYNEQQVFRLRQADGRWKICELGTSRTHVPTVRYGTPAFRESEPSGDQAGAEPGGR